MTYGVRASDGRYVEICDECGFDSRQVLDEAAELAIVYGRLAGLIADSVDADRRPQEDIFSAREYVAHCVDVSRTLLGFIARVLNRPALTVDNLSSAAAAVAALVPSLTDVDRMAVLHNEYSISVSVEWILRHLLHDLGHHVLDIRRGYGRLALGDLAEVVTVRRDRPL